MDDLTLDQWGELLRDMADVARRVHAAEQLADHRATAAAVGALLDDAEVRLARVAETLGALGAARGMGPG